MVYADDFPEQQKQQEARKAAIRAHRAEMDAKIEQCTLALVVALENYGHKVERHGHKQDDKVILGDIYHIDGVYFWDLQFYEQGLYAPGGYLRGAGNGKLALHYQDPNSVLQRRVIIREKKSGFDYNTIAATLIALAAPLIPAAKERLEREAKQAEANAKAEQIRDMASALQQQFRSKTLTNLSIQYQNWCGKFEVSFNTETLEEAQAILSRLVPNKTESPDDAIEEARRRIHG